MGGSNACTGPSSALAFSSPRVHRTRVGCRSLVFIRSPPRCGAVKQTCPGGPPEVKAKRAPACRGPRSRYLAAMSEPGELPEHVARNRVYWDEVNAPLYVEPGRRSWASDAITWGIFDVPEEDLGVLPTDLGGKDVIELGCGTAYLSAWLARRGANVTGVDNSLEQLKTARALQEEHDLFFPLIHGNAEAVPLADASFDLVVASTVPPSGPTPTGGSQRPRGC